MIILLVFMKKYLYYIIHGFLELLPISSSQQMKYFLGYDSYENNIIMHLLSGLSGMISILYFLGFAKIIILIPQSLCLCLGGTISYYLLQIISFAIKKYKNICILMGIILLLIGVIYFNKFNLFNNRIINKVPNNIDSFLLGIVLPIGGLYPGISRMGLLFSIGFLLKINLFYLIYFNQLSLIYSSLGALLIHYGHKNIINNLNNIQINQWKYLYKKWPIGIYIFYISILNIWFVKLYSKFYFWIAIICIKILLLCQFLKDNEE